MSKQRGLGRGLGSLIPAFDQGAKPKLQEIELDEISPNPNQVRKHMDEEAFADLVSSVREFGLLQPVVVRPRGMGFELVAGERRWRAAREAGLTKIPVVVRAPTEEEAMEIALVENVQREDLNALEEAAAYQQLMAEFKITQAEVAKKVGRSRAAVANTIRLLQLPESIKELVKEGDLSTGHARTLLSLKNEESQARLARRIIQEGLSVRQTENIAAVWQVPPLPKREPSTTEAPKNPVAEKLGNLLSTMVKVKKTSKNRGRIEINFTSAAELERILAFLMTRNKRRKTTPS